MNPKIKKFFKISLIIVISIIGLFFISITGAGVWLIKSKAHSEIPQDLLPTVKQATPEASAVKENTVTTSSDVSTSLSVDSGAIELSKAEALKKKYNADYQKDKKDPAKMAIMMVQILDFFEKVNEDLKKTSALPLCSNICEQSIFDEEAANVVGLPYLVDFYDQEKNRAFEDFQFRFGVASMSQLAKLINKDFREISMKVLIAQKENTVVQAAYVVKLQYETAKIVAYLAQHEKELDKSGKFFDDMEQLGKQCDKQPKDELKKQCESLLIQNPIFTNLE